MKPVKSKAKLPVSKEIIAHDFHNALHGKMDDKKFKAAKDFLLNMDTDSSYPAQGTLSGFMYYKVVVSITDGETFNGKIGALGSFGSDVTAGYVITPDIDALYSNTTAIQVTAAGVYLSVVFFDTNSNALGTYQGGGAGTVACVGGGTGSWS